MMISMDSPTEKKCFFFKVLAGMKGSRKWAVDKFTGRELFFGAQSNV